MPPAKRPALFTISIDLAPATTNATEFGANQQAAFTVHELITGVGLPATWATDDFHSSGVLGQIAASPDQELALRAEIAWTGKTASRALFARELTSRLTRARAQGRAVTTLALPRGAEVEHIDLTIKQGITAVRTQIAVPTGGAGANWFTRRAPMTTRRPRAIHYGLWDVAVTRRFAPERAWFGTTAAANVRAELDRSIDAGGHYHLLIDIAEFAAAGRRGEKALARVVAHADRRRQQGDLEFAGIRDCVFRLMPVREQMPARSILRRAAA